MSEKITDKNTKTFQIKVSDKADELIFNVFIIMLDCMQTAINKKDYKAILHDIPIMICALKMMQYISEKNIAEPVGNEGDNNI